MKACYDSISTGSRSPLPFILRYFFVEAIEPRESESCCLPTQSLRKKLEAREVRQWLGMARPPANGNWPLGFPTRGVKILQEWSCRPIDGVRSFRPHRKVGNTFIRSTVSTTSGQQATQVAGHSLVFVFFRTPKLSDRRAASAVPPPGISPSRTLRSVCCPPHPRTRVDRSLANFPRTTPLPPPLVLCGNLSYKTSRHQGKPVAPTNMRDRSRTTTPLTTPSTASSPSARRGLYAYVGHRVVELLTEPQLVDHAVSVLPQLHSVTTRPHFHGPHWTTLRKKHGVDMYEFDPSSHGGASPAPLGRRGSGLPVQPPSTGSSTRSTAPADSWLDGRPQSTTRATLPHGFQTQYKLPNPGIDMSYAVVAQCELEGHVNDVIDVLFNDEPIDFEASMKTLWANKLKRGDLLLSRSVQGRSLSFLDNNAPVPDVSGAAHIDELAVPLPGTLAIKTATVGTGLSLNRKTHGAEKLCYTSFTQRSPSKHEAFHVVKTLPLHIHDQIACGKSHVALRDPSIDHIAVGYHLTDMESVLGGPRTRLVICAYASAVPSETVSRASQVHWHPRMGGNVRMSMSGSSQRHGVNSDVRRVVMMLAKAARDFQQAVRQRRFGSQRFVYFPTDRNSCRSLEQSCVVCLRRFGFFRKDHYCQLCAHLVCRQCSKKHKVEPFAGKVRENRLCFPCVARVDTSAFHDEQLWKGMHRPVVVDADVISPLGYDAFDVIMEGDCESMSREGSKLTKEELLVDEIEQPTMALERSYGSTDSDSSPKSTAMRPEIQVAHDLFSPHPNRRASALEALSRAVLDARNSTDHANVEMKTPRRGMNPALVDVYLEEKEKARSSLTSRYEVKPPATTKSDHMQMFSVCYPRANPTALPSLSRASTSLHENIAAVPRSSTVNRTSHASVSGIDTAGFDSICEAAVHRLDYTVAFIAIKRRNGSRQIVGLHQTPKLRGRFPRHKDLVSYCPGFVASGGASPMIIVEPMLDIRFRYFTLVHDAGMRFFAQFPLAGIASNDRGDIIGASLCVLDVNARDQHISKEEFVTLETLCAVASDLVNCITT